MKKGKYIVLLSLAMIIVILGAYLYKYYPFFEAYYYNRYISVDKIKLLMSENELNKVLDYEGEFVHGMGGDGWDYKDIKVFVMTSSIGMFKNKVVSIDTENPSHSVLGISVGDDYSASVDIIKKNGFSEIYEGIFAKGNIYIQLFGETQISRLRIRIQDPKYRNAVF